MNIPEEAVEAAAEAAWAYDTEGINHGWGDELSRMKDAYREQARAALEAAWAVMHPEVTEGAIARDLDSRIPNDAPLWLERQVADRRAIADTVRHFAQSVDMDASKKPILQDLNRVINEYGRRT